jgi:hypothetical protein
VAFIAASVSRRGFGFLTTSRPLLRIGGMQRFSACQGFSTVRVLLTLREHVAPPDMYFIDVA